MNNTAEISAPRRVPGLRLAARASCVGLLLSLSASLQAQIIPTITSFQGVLSDAVGDPIDGSTTVMFSLYADSLGGSPVWSETKEVEAEDGVFHTYLGSVEPLVPSLFTGLPLFLGVKVESDAEMTPRRRLATVPYAFKAYDILCSLGLWYEDIDSDGFGNEDAVAIACTAPADHVPDKSDCDDGNDAVNPLQGEICDAFDNDCDGQVNEGDLSSSCDDADACTDDQCGPEGCVNVDVVCNDGNVCTVDGCESGSGCMFADLPDGTPCSGGECSGGVCVPDP